MKLAHRFDGDPAAPVVMFAGSLGSTLAMWEPQLPLALLVRRAPALRLRPPGGVVAMSQRSPQARPQTQTLSAQWQAG